MEQREQEQILEPVQSKEPTNPVKNEAWEWAKALLIAAALVFIIRLFIFAPFIVEGQSMDPNFATGERVIVNKIVYLIRKPHRDEVVVFHATKNKDYIKRVIALPGETVKVEGDKVFIDNKEIDQPYLKDVLNEAAKTGKPYNMRNFPETKVPDGKIFVMGDNRSNSSDSRFPEVGFIEYSRVVGRADLIFWPLNKISFVHF